MAVSCERSAGNLGPPERCDDGPSRRACDRVRVARLRIRRPTVSLLLADAALSERRAAAHGPLAPLLASLRAELDPLAAAPPVMPLEKARLSRAGGTCPHDGARLVFDPWSPHEHRCPRCGDVQRGEPHYRAWLMWYQLWLAERAVHGALLHLLDGRREERALCV